MLRDKKGLSSVGATPGNTDADPFDEWVDESQPVAWTAPEFAVRLFDGGRHRDILEKSTGTNPASPKACARRPSPRQSMSSDSCDLHSLRMVPRGDHQFWIRGKVWQAQPTPFAIDTVHQTGL